MAEKISDEGEKWVPKQGEGICTSIYLSLSPQYMLGKETREYHKPAFQLFPLLSPSL